MLYEGECDIDTIVVPINIDGVHWAALMAKRVMSGREEIVKGVWFTDSP